MEWRRTYGLTTVTVPLANTIHILYFIGEESLASVATEAFNKQNAKSRGEGTS